jgi:hypothetical protein
MAKVQWVNVLITKKARGAVTGIYSMDFEAEKTYRIDKALFDQFLEMGVCALTPVANNVLHVNSETGRGTWGAAKND